MKATAVLHSSLLRNIEELTIRGKVDGKELLKSIEMLGDRWAELFFKVRREIAATLGAALRVAGLAGLEAGVHGGLAVAHLIVLIH